MHPSGILPDRYRLRHLVTCESRCKYFPFLSHFLPIAAGQPGTITRRRRRWRDRTQCLSQTAAAAAADIALAQSHKLPPTERTDGADGRTDDLSPYLSSSGRKGSEEKPYLPNSISISCPRYSFHAEADTRTSALLSYPYTTCPDEVEIEVALAAFRSSVC